MATGIDEEGNKIAENIKLTKELIEEKRKLLEQQLLAIKIEADVRLPELEKNLEDMRREAEEIQKKLLSGDTMGTKKIMGFDTAIDETDKLKNRLLELTDAIQEDTKEVLKLKEGVASYNTILEENTERLKWKKAEELEQQAIMATNSWQLRQIEKDLRELGFTSNDVSNILSGNLDKVKKNYDILTDAQIANLISIKELNKADYDASMNRLNNSKELTKELIEDTKKRIQLIQEEMRALIGTTGAQGGTDLVVSAERRRLYELEQRLRNIDEAYANIENITVKTAGLKTDKASKSAKSAKEEYQAIADLYLKINLELEKNNQLLARNKTMQELAVENSQEHFDLIEKENELYKTRQDLLHQLANLQRAEMKALESELLVHGFTFTGEGDNRIITNLDNIKGKTKEVEEAFNRYIEIQSKLIPGLQQDWWDLQVSIVGNTGKIRDAIQALIEDLESLKDELEDFDFAEQMRDLNEQLETAKFTHWIENLILGFQRFNDQTELLQLKLSLFDEEDYQNRINVTAELYTASKDKLQAYKEEWNRLSAITPRNVEEANRIADAMKTVQQGMRDAFVATREYQREMKKIKVAAISKEFEKANKQLELQLSIIDHNIKSLQDGILPDFSLEMIMPIPDFTDIFNETASENEKLYKEHLSYEEQILELKQNHWLCNYKMQKIFIEKKNKLMQHYT